MHPDEVVSGGVADAESNQVEPVFGVSDLFQSAIAADLTLNTEDLSEGGLSDCNVTIIGWDFEQGGETKPSRDNPDETYVTKDSVIMHLRIDNTDEIGWDKEPFTYQKFSMPGTRVGKDGQARRARLNRNSAWGLWLNLMENLGVSTRESEAQVLHIKDFNDFIGLGFHRVRTQYDLGFNDRTMPLNAPQNILGMDNELRAEKGLPPLTLNGIAPAVIVDTPKAAAKKAS